MTDRESITPAGWSSAWWKTLFSVVVAYPQKSAPEEVAEDTRAMIVGMRSTLPCKKCRVNWTKTYKKHPLTQLDLSERDNLFKWMCDRFREINSRRRMMSNAEIASYFIVELSGDRSALHTVSALNQGLLVVNAIVLLAVVCMYLKYNE